MIALRKDVKVGFAIGGIALGVFGVYLALSALAGQKPDSSMTGANLQLTPFGSAAPTTVVDRSRTTPEQGVLPRTQPQTPANAGPTMANPTQQVTVAESNNGGDIWGNAFETGKLHPVVTVTPEAGKAATGNAPRPADVISAINQPQSNDRPSSTDTRKPETGSNVANASDPSGSLLDPTQSSLTRSNSADASGTRTHTVEVGETFSSIAATYYGDSKYYKQIADANPQIDANRLKPGMVVKVPPLAKKEPRSDTLDVPADSRIDPTKQYIVKPGDSLNRIASTLYGDSTMWQKIYDLNKSKIGESPAKLKLGMVLDLPTPPTR